MESRRYAYATMVAPLGSARRKLSPGHRIETATAQIGIGDRGVAKRCGRATLLSAPPSAASLVSAATTTPVTATARFRAAPRTVTALLTSTNYFAEVAAAPETATTSDRLGLARGEDSQSSGHNGGASEL